MWTSIQLALKRRIERNRRNERGRRSKVVQIRFMISLFSFFFFAVPFGFILGARARAVVLQQRRRWAERFPASLVSLASFFEIVPGQRFVATGPASAFDTMI